MSEKPLILISNDDGVHAKGIGELARLMQKLGDVVVVAPDGPRSGSAGAITPTKPIVVKAVSKQEGLEVYSCSGTPVDCVKVALEKVVPRCPDLVVSGINHGDNASINLHYSGTMGAVLEGCLKGIPSIGYSLRTREQDCDFTPYREAVLKVASHVLKNGLPEDVCLNVNFPLVTELKGICVCRMARGSWEQEWADTEKAGVYTLAGRFQSLEPGAEDTDWWVLDHDMASVVPIQLDMTARNAFKGLASLNETATFATDEAKKGGTRQ